MNSGKTVFSQLMSMIPEYEFDKCVAHYNGNHRVRRFSCWDHFYVMSCAQLTQMESLRYIDFLPITSNSIPSLFPNSIGKDGLSNCFSIGLSSI